MMLREYGTRYNSENVVARPPKEGVVLHCAGWVNWHAKCENLEFYNDEQVEEMMQEAQAAADEAIQQERPEKPMKPRRSKYESEEEYQDRRAKWDEAMGIWESTSPPQPNVQPKGNSMTQKYYSTRLLPVYLDAIQHAQQVHGHTFVLQEDGDPSHGMKKRGLAQRKRELYGVENLIHPPSSPDLNPSEACWNIWKQRMRKVVGLADMPMERLKEVANEVWAGITLEQVQDRIKDMPERCVILRKNGGKRIKGRKW